MTEVPGATLTQDALTLPDCTPLGAWPARRDPLHTAHRVWVAQVWLAALGVPLGGAPLFPPLAIGVLLTAPIAAALHLLARWRLAAALRVPLPAAGLRLTAHALFSEGSVLPLDEIEQARAEGDAVAVFPVNDGAPVLVARGHTRETREAVAEWITRMARRARRRGANPAALVSLAKLLSSADRVEVRPSADPPPAVTKPGGILGAEPELELTVIPVVPLRCPLDGLSPYDPDAVLRWALQRATDSIASTGRPRPALIAVLDDHVADVDLLTVAAGDPVKAFVALASRADVEHRVLQGGSARDGLGVAWVFVARNDERRSFWLATAAFRVRDDGLGVMAGPWDVVNGVNLSGVPDQARELARDEPALALLPARPPNTLQIGFDARPLPEGLQPPTDAAATIQAIVDLGVEAQVWQARAGGHWAMVFRGRALEWWQLTGAAPVGFDDILRAVCAFGEPADAVALLRLEVFSFEGDHHLAVRTTAQAAGVQLERVLELKWMNGPADQPSHMRVLMSDPKELGMDGWIGVEPSTPIDLFPIGHEA